MDEFWQITVRLIELIIACTAVGLTISARASKGREAVIKLLADQHKEAMEAIATTKKESDAQNEKVRRETGEAVGSMRQQITDLGFFIRDHYVREADFNVATSTIRDAISVMGDKLEARCMRIETEIRNVESELRNGHHRKPT